MEQPLSAITVASLRDLGYLVDDARADRFQAGATAPRKVPERPR